MFYDIYVQLCEQKGVSPSAAAIACGIAKSAVSSWKANWKDGIEVFPTNANTKKLAEYFGVTVDYLLGNEEKPTAKSDELETDELFAFYGDVKKNLTQADKDDIMALIRIRAELNKNKKG